ncbi:colanic acid biosynthesis glycosyltransferase WcaL [Aphanothece hegewaldii CCALA 016]|uniref:Colanic acid biosynthesis glycosyltransferase WcaL n=1 Tax=Aphanothece hegewaldii CCALA 016 TaxID=2107694 RepID=A0A2T1LWD9_9CHRO|nr:glycosyltransferase family 4 protein [Aphanothece hegewaldii]PSF36227.1 colanic acid biosynthesis glycosyltransferase WcaL [Aphanothece hegewaldii CCALA 016]
MTIAYLINQYPKISHSFIRREIIALEQAGIAIARFTVRPTRETLVDEADQQELEKTQAILDVGLFGLLFSLIQKAITSPLRWLKALKLAIVLGLKSERGVLIHLIYLAEACVFCSWLQEKNISHVHAHFGTNSATVALLTHILGDFSYSFTVHGPEEFDKVQAIALPEKIKQASFVIAISEFGRSQLYRWCSHEQWSKIYVIHCGVDQSFLNTPFQPIPDEPRMVCVGRLCEQKGQLLLVQAVYKLVQKNFNFKIVLVGDGELRQEIESLIKQYKLEKHIEITGWASGETVQKQILAAKAMILPSFAEGLPVVIMESLALSRPVLSTYVAGIPELVEPNVCGWLVPAGSVDALVTAIQNLLETSNEQLEQMGQVGAKRVQEQYNTRIEGEKLAKLFSTSINTASTSINTVSE